MTLCLTVWVCPILCALSSAWVSTPGFQYSSANTTRLAAVSVIPAAAAVMLRTATRTLSSVWNLSTLTFLASDDTRPSMTT